VSSSPADITIVHPWDPQVPAIGGFDTFLDGFLRYAPMEWRVELVGVTAQPDSRPPGKWQTLEYRGRTVRFFPVLPDKSPNLPGKVPLSLRFALTARLRRAKSSGRLLAYHRFESVFALPPSEPSQPSVIYLHNHPEEVQSPHSDVLWSRMPGLYKRLLLRTLRRAALVVAVDPRTPAWIREELPDWPGRVVWHQQWADPEVFCAGNTASRQVARVRLRQKLELPSDSRILVFAGRFEKQKDLPLLIEAFERAVSELDDLSLILVGEGRLRSFLRKRIEERRLERRIRILSSVPRDELAGVYRGCDLAVCTSGYESGPRYLFEAAACGLPVVSLDIGQVGRLVDDDLVFGSLVHERTAAPFVAALKAVMATPTDNERAERCARNAARFSPESGLQPIVDAYRSLLERAVDD